MDEIARIVREEIERFTKGGRSPITADQIKDTDDFAGDLGFDSLDMVEFVMTCQEVCNRDLGGDDKEDAIRTVGDLVTALNAAPKWDA